MIYNIAETQLYDASFFRLFCSMLCSDPKLDSHRFKDIIDEAIAEGLLHVLATLLMIMFSESMN